MEVVRQLWKWLKIRDNWAWTCIMLKAWAEHKNKTGRYADRYGHAVPNTKRYLAFCEFNRDKLVRVMFWLPLTRVDYLQILCSRNKVYFSVAWLRRWMHRIVLNCNKAQVYLHFQCALYMMLSIYWLFLLLRVFSVTSKSFSCKFEMGSQGLIIKRADKWLEVCVKFSRSVKLELPPSKNTRFIKSILMARKKRTPKIFDGILLAW